VAAATSRQVSNGSNPASDWEQGYGYQFWRCRHGVYRGDGAFGQYCIVMPEQEDERRLRAHEAADPRRPPETGPGRRRAGRRGGRGGGAVNPSRREVLKAVPAAAAVALGGVAPAYATAPITRRGGRACASASPATRCPRHLDRLCALL
jgi:hypothetical protein